jgi:hypothetical protein
MAAAPDLVSPELVLVDPQLAAYTRPLLADSAGAFWRLEKPSPSRRESHPLSVLGDARADAIAGARERLTERALDSEVPRSPTPCREHFRRRARLIPVTAAATSVILLVVQLYLNHGKLP